MLSASPQFTSVQHCKNQNLKAPDPGCYILENTKVPTQPRGLLDISVSIDPFTIV